MSKLYVVGDYYEGVDIFAVCDNKETAYELAKKCCAEVWEYEANKLIYEDEIQRSDPTPEPKELTPIQKAWADELKKTLTQKLEDIEEFKGKVFTVNVNYADLPVIVKKTDQETTTDIPL